MALWGFNSEEGNQKEKDAKAVLEPTVGIVVEQKQPEPPTAAVKAPESIAPAAPAVQAGFEEVVSKRFGNVRSALGPGTVIQGKLTFDTPVRIDGELNGEIFSSAALIIGETGKIDANITVDSLWVRGRVKGSMKVAKQAEVFEGASLEGEINTPRLSVREGAAFNAKCSMRTEKIVDFNGK